jgi:hypothetical protein
MIEELWVTNLEVGGGALDLVLQRHTDDVGISVLNKRGNVQVVAVK